MDELSLLEADSIEAVEAGLEEESASYNLPAPDFTGSLDYIDSLANRSVLTVNRRDVNRITTGLSSFDYLSPLYDYKTVPGPIEKSFNVSTDMRPLQDARMFDPQRSLRRAASIYRSAADVVSPFNDRFVNPPGPSGPVRVPNPGEYKRDPVTRPGPYRLGTRHFRRADQVVICLKRKIRRNVMHAFGFAGLTGFRFRRNNYWSRVIC